MAEQEQVKVSKKGRHEESEDEDDDDDVEKRATQGSVDNAQAKIRPDHIREWDNFAQEQLEVWEGLLSSDFSQERHFTSLNTIRENGNEMRNFYGSELDLGYYERLTVEDRVSLVIKRLCQNPHLRKVFNLLGEVTFENHGNTITHGMEAPSEGPGTSLPQTPMRKRQKKKTTEIADDDLPTTKW
ncbi:hypothetical protein FQN57_006667 [Myotisia sp. PD_48]|nr:hypothetical protein FQN57_006667 [Myotisia sp. PD_48]